MDEKRYTAAEWQTIRHVISVTLGEGYLDKAPARVVDKAIRSGMINFDRCLEISNEWETKAEARRGEK